MIDDFMVGGKRSFEPPTTLEEFLYFCCTLCHANRDIQLQEMPLKSSDSFSVAGFLRGQPFVIIARGIRAQQFCSSSKLIQTAVRSRLHQRRDEVFEALQSQLQPGSVPHDAAYGIARALQGFSSSVR